MRPRLQSGLVFLCFFTSGAAALILEIVWSRSFGILLGNSLRGISVVAGVYLLGLGMGALLASRVEARLVRPVRGYAALELSVGLWSLLGIALLPRLPELLALLLGGAERRPAGLEFLRLAAAFLFLLPPTLLMGMTLPILAKALERREDLLPMVGRLYGVNTLGAFAGTVAGGFWLLPALGASGTTAAAASLNGFVFVVALLALPPRFDAVEAAAARAGGPQKRGGKAKRGSPLREEAPAARKLPNPWVLGALFTLTGALALASEVAWTRALTLVMGASTYTFALTLASLLLGVGAGSLLWKLRRRPLQDPLAVYGALWLGIGLLLLAALRVLDSSPDLFLALYRSTCVSRSLSILGLLLLSASAVLPCALLYGLHFPVTAEALRARGLTPAAASGRALLWNSLGALSGTLAAGYLLLPSLGTAATLRAISAAAAAVGLLLLGLRLPRRLWVRAACVPAALALPALMAVRGPGLDSLLQRQGIYRAVRPSLARDLSPEAFREQVLQSFEKRFLFLEEGQLSTVAVQYAWGNLTLTVGGKSDASYQDMETQVLLGQIPLLVHPAPRDVFLIGYGSGVTARSALTHGPRRLDIAEIEPAVVRASRYFRHLAGDVLDRPGVRLLLEDGRTALTFGGASYDVVVSEPSNPWIAGVNALFTENFYALVRSRLNEGGVFCQWIPIYELTEPTVRVMLSGLLRVFPHSAFFDSGGDLLCVAGRDGPPALGLLAAGMGRNPSVRQDLEQVGVFGPEDLVVRCVNDGSLGTVPSPRNTDDSGFVEFRAPWELPAFLDRASWPSMEDFLNADPPALWRRLGWPVDGPGGMERLRESAAVRGRLRLEALLGASGGGASAHGGEEGLRAQELEDQADGLVREGRLAEAEPLLGQSLRLAPRNAVAAHKLAFLRTNLGEIEGARAILDALLRRGEWTLRYETLYRMGLLERARGLPGEGEAWLERALAMDPYREEAYLFLAEGLAGRGDRAGALERLEEGIRMVQGSERLAALRSRLSLGGNE